MFPAVGLLFLLGVGVVILLSGYWLASLNVVASLADRLAVAAVAGLATLLFFVAAVNLVLPLSGVGMAACLIPAGATLFWSRTRRQLVADVRTSRRSRFGFLVFAAAAVFLAALLGPALRDPQALFYDGTTNHDSYIWITSGEFLQSHTYLDAPVSSATQPWMNMADDNVGWSPRRGQLGAETLLALFSSLASTKPLFTCLYLSAALFLPWCAAVYLVVVTFFRERISRPAVVALVLLQPIFAFFYANSNLPNLVGAIMGAAVVVATEQALRATNRRHCLAWCGLLLAGFHGQLMAYPEMIPFVLLPSGLLWVRHWFGGRSSSARSAGGLVVAAFLAGGVINPVITVRAWRGFMFSFRTASTEDIFGNLFEPLNFAEYVPGFATLSIPAALSLGYLLGAVLTLMLVAAVVGAAWRARDRLGVVLIFAGSAVLLVYTAITGFKYGWQKSVQFCGAPVSAIVTVAVFETLRDTWRQPGWRRWAGGIALAGIVSFYAAATVANFSQIYEWSRQKVLSRDWFALQAMSETTLRELPILVEAASFRLPFFHSMWSSYFLSSSHVYFARRGGEGGGYMRLAAKDEAAVPGGRPAALLVGRRWGESFDANSPRLLTGREYLLLGEANRVTSLEGVYPLNGIPEHASPRFSIELTPHSQSRLSVTLAPASRKPWSDGTWRITHRTDSGVITVQEVSGPPPWCTEVPLQARVSQIVQYELLGPVDGLRPLPFTIKALSIERGQ